MRYILILLTFFISSGAMAQGIWQPDPSNRKMRSSKSDSVHIIPRDTAAKNNMLFNGLPVGDSGRIAYQFGKFWGHDDTGWTVLGSHAIDTTKFIRNGTSPQTANYNITGNGTIGSTLKIATANPFAPLHVGTLPSYANLSIVAEGNIQTVPAVSNNQAVTLSQLKDSITSLIPGRVVPNVSDLSSYGATTGDTIILVSNPRSGGTFTWSSTGYNDNGIVVPGLSGYWHRQMTDNVVQANWFGYGDTTANKLAISKAISATAALSDSGGVVQIPYYMGYNYSRITSARQLHPLLDTVNRNVTIIDFSPGSGYPNEIAPDQLRDGAQVRYYFKTRNQTSEIHDGNGIIMRAKWHPHVFLSNDGNDTDNRRASIVLANNGFTTWIVGQGTKSGFQYTDAEKSAFRISGIIGDSTNPLTTLMTILKQNGRIGFRVDPLSDYHFHCLDTSGASTQGVFRFSNGKPGNLSFVWVTAARTRLWGLDNSTGLIRLTNDNASSNVFSISADGSVQAGSGNAATSTLQSAGSLAAGILGVTGNTTLTSSHCEVIVNNTGAATITLAPAAGCPGRIVMIKKVSANGNDVVIKGNGAETIDGVASKTLTLQNSSVSLVSNGTSWFIMASHASATTL